MTSKTASADPLHKAANLLRSAKPGDHWTQRQKDHLETLRKKSVILAKDVGTCQGRGPTCQENLFRPATVTSAQPVSHAAALLGTFSRTALDPARRTQLEELSTETRALARATESRKTSSAKPLQEAADTLRSVQPDAHWSAEHKARLKSMRGRSVKLASDVSLCQGRNGVCQPNAFVAKTLPPGRSVNNAADLLGSYDPDVLDARTRKRLDNLHAQVRALSDDVAATPRKRVG